MKSYAHRFPDTQYRDLLELVLNQGKAGKSQQGVDALTYIAPPAMRFDLERNGFPMITERNMAPNISARLPVTIWRQAIGEMCGFVNGARTTEQLEKFGCYWWKDWATAEKCAKRGLDPGDLGPGSYGAAFHDFPTAEGGSFNQFEAVIQQIKELPHLRTHVISPWLPQYVMRGKGRQQKVVVAPCHGWLFVHIADNRLTVTMVQRSGDLPIGIPSNMIQYAALTMMLAQVTGYEVGEFIHQIVNAHIYVDQIWAVEKMLERGPRPFPTVRITDEGKKIASIFDFGHSHFELSDYDPHPGIKGIPVAV